MRSKSSGAPRKAAKPSHRDFQEEKKEKLLELTAENDRITINEMAEEMSLSKATINKMIAVLKQEGRPARMGTNRNGYRVILENGAKQFVTSL